MGNVNRMLSLSPQRVKQDKVPLRQIVKKPLGRNSDSLGPALLEIKIYAQVLFLPRNRAALHQHRAQGWGPVFCPPSVRRSPFVLGTSQCACFMLKGGHMALCGSHTPHFAEIRILFKYMYLNNI